jgi:predicted DNA-binding mobile mystery protein A
MSSRELADRSGLSQQRISQIEQAEQDGSLTLATLEHVAAGLDCRVEYVLVPLRPLDDMVWDQARAKAIAEIHAVDHTMALEDQRPSAASTDDLVDSIARRLVDKRGLWS